MRLLTHIAGSQAVWLMASAVGGLAPDPASLAFAALGSCLPELDKPDSLVGRIFPFSSLIEERFGHRGIAHSLFALSLLALASLPLWLLWGRFIWWLALLLGYLSHLILDMATVEGVQLFWPHPGRAVFPGRDDLRLDQSSPSAPRAETAVMIALIAFAGLLWPLSQTGITRALVRAIGTLENTLPEYHRLSPGYRVLLEGRFSSRVSGEVYEGRFPIVGVYGEGYVVEVEGVLMSVCREGCDLVPLGKVRLIKGEPVHEEALELDLSGLPLGALSERIPEGVEHWITGTLVLEEPISPPIYPDRWNPVRGSSTVSLQFARLEDLEPYFGVLVDQGHVVVRIRRPPGETRNPSPVTHHPSPTYIRPVELRLRIPTLSDLKVSVGDEVEEGDPIAVEATEEILGAMRDLREARSLGGIVGMALAWLAEQRLASLKAQSLILSPISGTVAGVKVEGGDEEGITVVLRLCPASAPPAGTSLCRARASDEGGAPPAGGPSHNPACCPVEAYFVSPRIDHVIKRVLLELIRGAKESIEIAIYSFTDDDLGEAVVEAYRRGVRVRVIMDTSQPKARGGEYRRLIEAGIPVLVERLSGLMHHKFMVVDREVVVTGSYNWSAAADDRNFENAIVVRDPEVAGEFLREFERLWEALSEGRTP